MTAFEKNLPASRVAIRDLLGVTTQAMHQFVQQGWFPLERAKVIAGTYDVPLRDLVRPDIREAMNDFG